MTSNLANARHVARLGQIAVAGNRVETRYPLDSWITYLATAARRTAGKKPRVEGAEASHAAWHASVLSKTC